MYEVVSEQPISGTTRSAHRAAANRALLEAVESDPRFARQLGKIHKHHIKPKYPGGAKNGATVEIDAAYHQLITNEFRRLWGYGKGKPSATQLKEIMEQVYKKYPLPPK